MNDAEFYFELKKNNWSNPISNYFKNATDGISSNFKTNVALCYDDDFFNIKFDCLDNPFVNTNSLTEHNSELYNQEVFELFISPNSSDPLHYLELEINPNNAIWVGKIYNEFLGEGDIKIEKMLTYAEAGIIHSVSKNLDSWSGIMRIPWHIVGKSESNTYRLNFYRIRSKVNHSEKNWSCNDQNSDFLCWSPTLSGAFAAFHRPKRFGTMRLV